MWKKHKKLQIFVWVVLIGCRTNVGASVWMTNAYQRIDQYRKGDLEIVVTDDAGNPLSGVPVHVKQRQHAFLFGTAVRASYYEAAELGIPRNELNFPQFAVGETPADWANMAKYCREYFNAITPENAMKWRFEKHSTMYDVATSCYKYATKYGQCLRGHCIIWPHLNRAGAVNHDYQLSDGSGEWTNSDITNQWALAGQVDTPDFTQWIRECISNRIDRITRIHNDKVVCWDVLNEPTDDDTTGEKIWLEQRWAGGTIDLQAGSNLPSATGVQQLADIRAKWIKMGKEASPEATAYLNHFGLISDDPGQTNQLGSRLSIIQNIIDALNAPNRVNAPGALEGIGFQGHFNTPTSAETIWDRMERIAALDRSLKLSVTEYDYQNYANLSDVQLADQLEYVMTAIFSHPQGEAFMMWGIWDGEHWLEQYLGREDAPMFDMDWNLKPAGQRYLDLVFDRWSTDETVVTDAQGRISLRAFHGELMASALLNNHTYRTIVTLDPDAPGITQAALVVHEDTARLPVIANGYDPVDQTLDVRFATDSGTNYVVQVGSDLLDHSSWTTVSNFTGSGRDCVIEYASGTNRTFFIDVREQ